jgi:pimeloyl-ACP methyl ester carboxylesterase
MMGSMQTVTSRDGTPIAYERGGEGPPLVLVHGTTSDHLTWEFVLPELREHFTVYAIDRRGRSNSGDDGGSAYDIEREFEDVVAVIDSIGGTAGLLGHSYGAICALEGALRSNRVRKLVPGACRLQNGAGNIRARSCAVPDAGVAPDRERVGEVVPTKTRRRQKTSYR